MSESHIVLAMGQMQVWPGELERNLERAAEITEEASQAGAHIVVLPETMDLGWAHLPAKAKASEIPDGETVRRLSELARRNNIYLCAGLTEREGDAIFNAAVLIDSEGQIRLKHRKIHELDFAQELYETGKGLSVCETTWGRTGLMICADAFVPDRVIARALGEMKAKIILSPCAWAVPANHDQIADPYGKLWVDSYQPVAREFSMWIAGVSNVGPIISGAWAGRRCIGCSLLIGPAGKAEANGPYDQEAILYAKIPLIEPL